MTITIAVCRVLKFTFCTFLAQLASRYPLGEFLLSTFQPPYGNFAVSDFMVCRLLPRCTHMEIRLKIYKQPDVTNSAILEPDYSRFTLIELFRARYWIDKFTRADSLENEIQKRCEHIQQQMTGKSRDARTFRPYGLRVGAIFFCLTVGPFLTVTFLNGMNLIRDVHRDMITLSGLWSLLTLPGLVMISMIGGRIDAERIIRSFNLSGRKDNKSFSATFNAL